MPPSPPNTSSKTTPKPHPLNTLKLQKQQFLYQQSLKSYDARKYLAALKYVEQIDMRSMVGMRGHSSKKKSSSQRKQQQNMQDDATDETSQQEASDSTNRDVAATHENLSHLKEQILILKGRILTRLHQPFRALPIFLSLFHTLSSQQRHLQLQIARELVNLFSSLYCFEDAKLYANYLLEDEELKQWIQERMDSNLQFENLYVGKVMEKMRKEMVFVMAKLFMSPSHDATNPLSQSFEETRQNRWKQQFRGTIRTQFRANHPGKSLPRPWEKLWEKDFEEEKSKMEPMIQWIQSLSQSHTVQCMRELTQFIAQCEIINFSRRKVLLTPNAAFQPTGGMENNRVQHTKWTCSHKNEPFFQFEYCSVYDPICEETHFCKYLYLLEEVRPSTDSSGSSTQGSASSPKDASATLQTLEFGQPTSPTHPQNRRRILVWFDKPYSKVDTLQKEQHYKGELAQYLRRKQWHHLEPYADHVYDLICSFARNDYHATCSLPGNQTYTTPDKVPPLTIFVRNIKTGESHQFFKTGHYHEWFEKNKVKLADFKIQFHRNVSINGTGESFTLEDENRAHITCLEHRDRIMKLAAQIRMHKTQVEKMIRKTPQVPAEARKLFEQIVSS